MTTRFEPGDYLIFQLEAGYGLLRVLRIDDSADPTWHIAAYDDFFLDVEQAEAAINGLKPSHSHLALTNRAFESTQVAKLCSLPLSDVDLAPIDDWDGQISDRSVRLLMGFR